MKFLSSVEAWHSIFEWSSIGLVALTVVAGAGALITARIVNNRQTERIRNLDIDVANARTKQAEAEKSLLELQRLIQEPRTIDRKLALEILTNGPRGSVKVLFAVSNEDASRLASFLCPLLSDSGWTVTACDEGVGIEPTIGICIELNGEGWDTKPESPTFGILPEPARTLEKALQQSVKGNSKFTLRGNRSLAKDELVLFIGAKY
jgi:hypothetical protein